MFIAANWKMNLDKAKIYDFVEGLNDFKFDDKVKACIFPSAIHIDYLSSIIQNIPMSLGGQNCHYNQNGAFTGDISSISLKLSGCDYVILGHSERRQSYNEDNNYIKKCAEAAINSGLTPIICVGESLETRESGNALDYIKLQINQCLPDMYEFIFIAYEPIWAIGTGEIPDNDQIEEIHTLIKNESNSKKNKTVKVLYGGSVNPFNANEIMSIKNVDGTLIGGASLNVKDFLAIYSSAVKQINVIS